MPRFTFLLKLILLVLFLGVVVSVLHFADLEQVRAWINSFDPILAPLIYIGVYIIATVLLLPVIVLSLGGAILFGPYAGTLYTWIGATIGSTLAFLLAKFLGRDFVEYLLAGRFQEFERRVEKHGFTSLLILRLLPWFPMNGINFASGLTRIRLWDFVLATVIGILPGTFVYMFLFAKLGDQFLRKEWHWSDLADPELGVAVVLFVALIGFGRWFARRIQQREPV